MLKRPKSLTQQAADEIRRRILRGDVELGAPLSENALAAELGVSKTPVREALLQLKMEGLVAVHPQRGSFVFDMTAAQVADLGQLREVMELAAFDLAVDRQRAELIAAWHAILAQMAQVLADGDNAEYGKLDATFHDALFEHCGNEYISGCYRAYAFRVQALRVRLAVDSAANGRSLDEHRDIARRVEQGDIAGARQRLREHMRDTVTRVTDGEGGDGIA